MRIELPSPSWADAHRAQEDAHTLTVSAHRTLPPLASLLLAAEADGVPLRVAVPAGPAEVLTLTL